MPLAAVLGAIALFFVPSAIAYAIGPTLASRYTSGQVTAYWTGWAAIGTVLIGVTVPFVLARNDKLRRQSEAEERTRREAREQADAERLERARFSATLIVRRRSGGGIDKIIHWKNTAST